jgi:beta-fructofuranosidase
VGDCIPYYEDGKYYVFYLHDPRSKSEKFAEDTTWYLVSTTNFINFEEHGEAIHRGGDDQPNKNIYTGSVIKAVDGTYYAFYTAFNDQYRINGKSRQLVMAATGKDLSSLKTDKSFLLESDDKIYETFDWRDPFVFWNEDEKSYWMILAARLKGSGAHRGGCLALCKSKDLVHWSYEDPFYAPNMYITMECPDLFRIGDYWYLVFSTFSDRFVTHYRMAKTINGPWIIPVRDAFDCRANYAIKTASDGKNRYTFGWIASKASATDQGEWEWGGTLVTHKIRQEPSTGLLYSTAPWESGTFFRNTKKPRSWRLFNAAEIDAEKSLAFSSETLGAALIEVPGDGFEFELELEVQGNGEFGMVLHGDLNLEEGYFLRMDPKTGIVAWDLWPRTKPGEYQWQIAGDKPYIMETAVHFSKKDNYHLRIIREFQNTVVYINDEAALSCPLYNFRGGYIGPYIVQGTVIIRDCSVNTL